MKRKSSRLNEAYLNTEKMEIEFFFFQAEKKASTSPSIEVFINQRYHFFLLIFHVVFFF